MEPQTRAEGGSGSFTGAELPEIRACLERITTSSYFASSPRMTELLRYLVEHAISSKEPPVSEYAIGLDVFGRPPSFDPRLDSIVRTEISRLRQRLKNFYAADGRSETVCIHIPQRSYSPSIVIREPETSVVPVAEPVGTPKRRWVLPAAALAGGLAIVIALRWNQTTSPANTLVVLPFQNLSPNGEYAYVADGVTEELTNELAQQKDLRVVARTSANVFKNKAADIREIGRKLNVAAVLEGSVAREGDRVRITAQLNRTHDGYHLWSRSYESSYSEILQVQAQVSEAVYAAVRVKGASEPSRVASTGNPEAHDLYLRASFQFAQRTSASLQESRELFEEAVAKDPSYVNAYRGIARTEIALIHITAEAPRPGFVRARKALEAALNVAPHDAESLGQLADIDYVYGWDWPRAEREFRSAIDQGAQSTTHSYYGWALATRGRFEEAHRQLRLAQDLDPMGEGPRFNEVMAYILERRFDDARRLLQQGLNPLDTHVLLGLVAYYKHDCKESSSQFEWAANKVQAPLTIFGLALASACRGDADQARQYLAGIASQKSSFVSPYQLAMGYAAIREKDSALAYLEKSGEAREGQIFYIPYDQVFDGIRSDPRFIELERKAGLK